LGVLNFILKILDIILKSKSLIGFVKNNKTFSTAIIIGLLIMTCSSFWLIQYHKDYVQYGITKNDNDLVKKIHVYLKECGDKTAISISTISTVSQNDVWVGSFKIAKACDIRNGHNCIINLKDRNPSLYLEDQDIKFNSYFFLVGIGLNNFSTKFDLRLDGKQDLRSLNYLPSIKKMIEKTDWSNEGIVHNLLITSIVNRDKNVLYVITFLTGKSRKELSCLDQDNIINEIKKLIIER
jgi:hypothetical protein